MTKDLSGPSEAPIRRLLRIKLRFAKFDSSLWLCILTFRWTVVSRYAALRSSDFPPNLRSKFDIEAALKMRASASILAAEIPLRSFRGSYSSPLQDQTLLRKVWRPSGLLEIFQIIKEPTNLSPCSLIYPRPCFSGDRYA